MAGGRPTNDGVTISDARCSPSTAFATTWW
jgi:hypothetical protein